MVKKTRTTFKNRDPEFQQIMLSEFWHDYCLVEMAKNECFLCDGCNNSNEPTICEMVEDE